MLVKNGKLGAYTYYLLARHACVDIGEDALMDWFCDDYRSELAEIGLSGRDDISRVLS